MASRLTEIIVDCHDIERMAGFWCAVLGYEKANAGEGWLAVRAPGSDPSDEALRGAVLPPALAFVIVPEEKVVKNRVHIDVTPIDRTQDEEVDRLQSLGATRVDIGQGKTPWIVMADPEGNELCVMPAVEAFLG
jgi:Glyoxalase-like domain